MPNLSFFRDSRQDIVTSTLFDEKTYYRAFIRDLSKAKQEVIIESPYITGRRMNILWPVFNEMLLKEVNIYVITRDPREHNGDMKQQSESEITKFESCGVQTLICTGHDHRKLAIIDRRILWEGSLNILSQTNSREIMRRIQSVRSAEEMFSFLKLGRYI